MKKFILGLLIGVFLSVAVFFFHPWGRGMAISLGRLLDRDIVYLHNNQIIQGWIIEENDDTIWMELEQGSFTLPRAQCQSIQKNTFLRYIRKIM